MELISGGHLYHIVEKYLNEIRSSYWIKKL